MARFVFQLEGVLEHRRHVERQKQRDLAVAQAQLSQLEAELRRLDESVRQTNEDVRRNHLTGVLDMNFLAAHRRFMNATQRQAMNLVQRMALAQRKAQEAQKALIEAAKQRKVIEKLRERYQQRWQAELDRREMLAQDELTTQLSFELRRPGEVPAEAMTE